MTVAKPSRTLTIMAWLADHPRSTSRDVATMLAERAPTHSELTTAHAALRSLEDRGEVEREEGSWPIRWRLVERARESAPLPEPTPALPRPEYVDVVIERLVELRKLAPEHLFHLIDYCQVDLGRALGRVPLMDGADDE
jgi:hypothetical protein